MAECKNKLLKTEKFGEVVRQKRLAAGLSQPALAKKSGISFGYIQKLEYSKNDIELSLEFAYRLSIALNSNLYEMFICI